MKPLDWLDSLQGSGIRPGLGRMRVLLLALGSPHRAVPAVIVAGTNGKGSTSAMLASILTASGLRTAHYTSPHLVEMRERWTIDGEMISPEVLDAAIEDIRGAAAATGITPTYFEALTLIAFIAFAEEATPHPPSAPSPLTGRRELAAPLPRRRERVAEGRVRAVDISVLEVGMGGRLDATNVVKPRAALITPIGFDHTEFLGNTLRKIAREKAGVIHRGTIVLTSNDDPHVVDVLRKRAAQFGNRFIHVTEEHDTPLKGTFQRRNAGLAVRAARELGIGDDAIKRGIASTKWRGRLEHRVVSGKEIWIDGAHNLHAIEAVAPFLDAEVVKPRVLVFGIMRDKNVDAVKARLFPLFDRVITTEPYAARSMKATDLGGIAIPDPDDALRFAMQGGERAIVVAGSLYLAGAAIAFFDKIARP